MTGSRNGELILRQILAVPCIVSLLLAACSSQPDYRSASDTPPTVSAVDIERYAGLWHEIARYPNSFQRGCGATTAQYTPLDDGSIRVVNTCRLVETGEQDQAEGVASVVEGSNGSKLKVRFAPGWIPFAEGDYWIFYLAQDYSVALVGDPDGKYLWVLARDPDIAQARLTPALERARELGFQTEPLLFSHSL